MSQRIPARPATGALAQGRRMRKQRIDGSGTGARMAAGMRCGPLAGCLAGLGLRGVGMYPVMVPLSPWDGCPGKPGSHRRCSSRNLAYHERSLMTTTAKTILYFGFYVLALGVILITFPNSLLSIFGFQESKEPWLRVLGVVVAALGYYYVVAARSNARAFFNATIYGRVWVFLAFAGLAAVGMAKPALILFGAADLLGAIWTFRAQRFDAQA